MKVVDYINRFFGSVWTLAAATILYVILLCLKVPADNPVYIAIQTLVLASLLHPRLREVYE